MIVAPDTHYDQDYWSRRKPYRKVLPDGTVREEFYVGPALWWDGFGPLAEALVWSLDRPVRSWLDIGCGGGCLVTFLVGQGIDAYGVDISEHAIAHAPEAVRSRVRCSDVLRAGIDGSYDVVSATDLVEHLYHEDQEQLWSVFWQATRPGGLLVLDIGTAHADDEVWVATRGEAVPIEREYQAVAGHVDVRLGTYWHEWGEARGWRLEREIMQRFEDWRRSTPSYAQLIAWGPMNFMVFSRG